MSTYNEQIQQHNTTLQALIDTANALPEAGSGSGGGSVETCTVTISPDIMNSFTSPTYYYTEAISMTIQSLTTQDATIIVPKNTILIIINWSSYSLADGACNQIFYNSIYTAYEITGDCTFTYYT